MTVHGGFSVATQALYADLDEMRFWSAVRTADDIADFPPGAPWTPETTI